MRGGLGSLVTYSPGQHGFKLSATVTLLGLNLAGILEIPAGK